MRPVSKAKNTHKRLVSTEKVNFLSTMYLLVFANSRNGFPEDTWVSVPEEDQEHATGRYQKLLLSVGCLRSQQHANVSQGRICWDMFTRCHTEIEVADQDFYLTQSHYTGTGPASPGIDRITPGARQDSHWNAIFKSLL